MAIKAQMTQWFWSTSTASSTSSTAALDGVVSWTAPTGAAAVIDVTDILSTAKEKMIGLRDEGEITLTLHYNATNPAQKNLIANRASGAQRMWMYRLVDNSTLVQSIRGLGYCSQFEIVGAVDDKIVANVVIMIDGPVTYIAA